MPTPTVKSGSVVSSRWAKRAAAASGDYRDGVNSTGKSWAGAAKAAEASWMAGITEANGRKAFSKGVDTAGDKKWKNNTLQKGPGRYAEGVGVGEGEYQKGVQPFLDVASRTDLPQPGPRGSEQNYQRSTLMAKAFRAYKVGRK